MWDSTNEREITFQVAAEEQVDIELLQVADRLFDEMYEQEEQFSMYEKGNIFPF